MREREEKKRVCVTVMAKEMLQRKIDRDARWEIHTITEMCVRERERERARDRETVVHNREAPERLIEILDGRY